MATGPCGVEFRDAFSCFHYSEADPKGSDCLEPFALMSKCMSQYPGVYGNNEDDDIMNVADEAEEEQSKDSSKDTSSSSSRELQDSKAAAKSWS